MNDADNFNVLQNSIATIRWLARIWGLLSVGFVLMFAIGEGFNPAKLTERELMMFLFFPLGVCAGILLAWWREGAGGAASTISLLAFYFVDYYSTGRFPKGWAFAFVGAPGMLSLLCFLLSRLRSQMIITGK